MKNRHFNLIILFLILLVFPLLSHAGILDTFNENLIKNISEQMSGASTKVDGFFMAILPICLVIAVFIIVKNSFENIIVELTKLSFALYLSLACAGVIWHPLASVNKSLDSAVFLSFKSVVDKAATNAFGDNVQDKFEQAFNTASDASSEAIEYKNCNGDQECISGIKNKDKSSTEKDQSSSNWGMDVFKKIAALFDALRNPMTYVSAFVNIMIVVSKLMGILLFLIYSISVPMSLFLFKMIVPFSLIPSLRPRIINTVKIPMSFALWEMLNKLFMWVSASILTAIGVASSETLSQATTGEGLMVLIYIPFMFLSMLVIHVVVIAKIPQLSRDLMNLSFETLVGVVQGAIQTLSAMAATAAVGAGAWAAGKIAGKGVGNDDGGLGVNIGPSKQNSPPPSSGEGSSSDVAGVFGNGNSGGWKGGGVRGFADAKSSAGMALTSLKAGDVFGAAGNLGNAVKIGSGVVADKFNSSKVGSYVGVLGNTARELAAHGVTVASHLMAAGVSENGQMAANAVTSMTGKGAVQTVNRYKSEMGLRRGMLESRLEAKDSQANTRTGQGNLKGDDRDEQNKM